MFGRRHDGVTSSGSCSIYPQPSINISSKLHNAFFFSLMFTSWVTNYGGHLCECRDLDSVSNVTQLYKYPAANPLWSSSPVTSFVRFR